jgi:hypothetical protein
LLTERGLIYSTKPSQDRLPPSPTPPPPSHSPPVVPSVTILTPPPPLLPMMHGHNIPVKNCGRNFTHTTVRAQSRWEERWKRKETTWNPFLGFYKQGLCTHDHGWELFKRGLTMIRLQGKVYTSSKTYSRQPLLAKRMQRCCSYRARTERIVY